MAGESSNLNHDLCDMLHELADYEKKIKKKIREWYSYMNAAKVLAEHPASIQSGREAQNLKGIEPRIAAEIDEYLSTGTLEKLRRIRNDELIQVALLLMRVSGIGFESAKKFYNDGVRTLEDLDIDKLTHHQQIGLKYFEDFETKIPRAEMEDIEKILFEIITKTDENYQKIICGSYRRGKPETRIINLLITHPDFTSIEAKNNDETSSNLLNKVVTALKACNFITDEISFGPVKFSGVCKLKEISRRLDIRLTPHDQYHFATLHLTGSDIFNIEMRTHALKKGFTLNEYCLRPVGTTGKPGEQVEVNSERDIFDLIAYPYKNLNERN